MYSYVDMWLKMTLQAYKHMFKHVTKNISWFIY